MVRIAYCLLVHRNPEQVKRLVDRLRDSRDRFHITVFGVGSSKSSADWTRNFEPFQDRNLGIVFKRGSGWGTFRTVAATLAAMRSFSESDYDYFVNLSGQDYPLKSREEIERKFGEARLTFMTFREYLIPGARRVDGSDPSGPRSVEAKLERFTHLHYRFALREYGVVLKIPRLRKALPYGLVPFGGSQWFCMTRAHVDYILDYVAHHPAVVRFFKRAGIPDERFFQTVMMNSSLKSEVVNDNLRYLVWTTGGRPRTLGAGDLSPLLSSDKLWARKFDIDVDRKILDELDRAAVEAADPRTAC